MSVGFTVALGIASGQARAPEDAVVHQNMDLRMCEAGCEFSDLIDFRDWVYDRVIVGNVAITLHIADGTYPMRDQFFINDPKFGHVRIIGNVDRPDSVKLEFGNGGNNLPGFGAVQGGRLGFIDGLSVNGVSGHLDRMRWRDQSFNGGLSAVGSGSTIHAGGHLVVNDFYYGLIADEGGEIFGDPGLTANRAGDVDIFARHGGVIHCLKCRANTAAHVFVNRDGSEESLGANFMAEAGGHLYIDGSVGTDAQVLGVGARSNGSLWAHDIEVSGSAGYGVQVDEGGSAEIGHARLHGNKGGVLVTSRGWVNIDRVEVFGNRQDGIVADGGSAGGLEPRVVDNGGVGFRSVKGGRIEGYGALRASGIDGSRPNGGNRGGLSSIDLGIPCRDATAVACIPPAFLFLN